MDCSQPVCPLLYRMSAALTRNDRALLCLPVSMEMHPKKMFPHTSQHSPTDSNSQRSADKKKSETKSNGRRRSSGNPIFFHLAALHSFRARGVVGLRKKRYRAAVQPK